MINRFTRRSINIDDDNFARCKILAVDMAGSISGVIRLLIKNAYEQHVIVTKQETVGPGLLTNKGAERLSASTF